MKREKILQILLPFLVVVALVVWGRGLGGGARKVFFPFLRRGAFV